MSVRIITDSASDYLPDEVPGLTVLPLGITFDQTTYRDGIDLTHRRFYELLVESDELPHTNAVTPYDFGLAFDEAASAGDDVVVVTLGEKLSATNQSARIAADGRDQTIRIIDSESVCVGERVLVDLAMRLAEQGLDANAIADTVERRADDVCVVALLDTLEYLVKGGRLSAAAGAAGALLSIKPVVTVRDGEVVLLGKARGSKNGKNLLNQQIAKAGGIDFSLPLAVGYSGLDDALLGKYVEDSRDLWEGHLDSLPMHSVGGTIGTHVGPGCIAVAFFRAQ